MLDFLIIGGTKCASTSIADYVAASQNINFSKVKEPSYLHHLNFIDKIDYYKSLYDFDANGKKGEGSTANSDFRNVNTVIENLKLINSTPKIILSVRNQVKRIESHYLQIYKSRGVNKNSNTKDFFRTNMAIYTRGMYGHVAKSYIEEFGSENVLILNFDDILTENSTDLQRLNDFLQLGYTDNFNLPTSNISYESVRDNFIYRFYKDYISEYYRESSLPSLKGVKNWLDLILPKHKITHKDRFSLDSDEIDFIERFYKTDNEIFREITNWSYFDLKK